MCGANFTPTHVSLIWGKALIGIGFVSNKISETPHDLVLVAENCEAPKVDSWLVTHVDLHRTASAGDSEIS